MNIYGRKIFSHSCAALQAPPAAAQRCEALNIVKFELFIMKFEKDEKVQEIMKFENVRMSITILT